MRILIFALLSFVGTHAHGGRKASIPIDSGLKVINTSKDPVTFSFSCKDSAGASAATQLASPQTLNPGGVATILGSSASGACGSGWSENTIDGALASMKRCYKANAPTWSEALTTACAANWNPCSLTDVISRKGTADATSGGAFTASGTWSQYDGSTWTDYSGNTTHYGVTKFYSGSSTQFATGSQGSGAKFNNSGWVTPIESPVYDMACCMASGNATVCEIEITSATGHLSSPSFLGGKAF